MSREYWYFLGGVAAVLVPLLAYLVYDKVGLWGPRPDRTITYREVDGHLLKLHVFEARGRDADPPPALLLFHGGAWRYGNPQQFYPQCDYLSRHGLTCISAQYRIESRHGTDPRAAIQDARAALRYLHRHARSLAIDPQRIAAGGGSAGGHLAAALGVPLPLPDEAGATRGGDIRPGALVLYNPMVDLAPCRPDHHQVADYWQDVSPMQHIDGKVPPTLILLGTQDVEVPVPTARAYCEAMQALGGRCELALFRGAKHGFFNQRVEDGRYFEQSNERVLHFLRDLGYLASAPH